MIGRRAAVVLPLAALAGSGLGCVPAEHSGSRALYELERLAFVPAGRLSLDGVVGEEGELALEEPLVVDRYELTRGDWLHYRASTPPDPGWHGYAADGGEALPVSVDWFEASSLAAQRGMRLLTAREWLYVAIGPNRGRYPDGRRHFQRSTANTLELGLYRPAPVGTFESGVGWRGCYDLLGNVWEWVADRPPGSPRPGEWDDLAIAGARVSAMGGSFLSAAAPSWTVGLGGVGFHALVLDPRHRAPDLGVRHGASAMDYLWRAAPSWGDDDEARRRVQAVGRRFGRPASRMCRELAQRPAAPRALRWLADGTELAR